MPGFPVSVPFISGGDIAGGFRKRIVEDEGVRNLWSEDKVATFTTPGFSTFYRLISDGTYGL